MTAKIIDLNSRIEAKKEAEEYEKFIQSYLSMLGPKERQAFHDLQKRAEELAKQRKANITPEANAISKNNERQRDKLIGKMNVVLHNIGKPLGE